MVTYCNGFVISSQVVCTEPKSARPYLTQSDQVNLVSGIAQGSGMGPIMFITFINEPVEIYVVYVAHGIRVKFFADDSRMYAEIIDGFDVERLHAALDTQWAEKWQLLTSAVC